MLSEKYTMDLWLLTMKPSVYPGMGERVGGEPHTALLSGGKVLAPWLEGHLYKHLENRRGPWLSPPWVLLSGDPEWGRPVSLHLGEAGP